MNDELYKECEEQFREIANLLDSCDELPKAAAEAYILAWRMQSRLEELRLRHPII